MRVLVLDPHPVVRVGLQGHLEQSREFESVAGCSDLRTAVLMIEKLTPDVVVTELELGGREGAAAVRELARHLPGGGVLVFTGLPSPCWRAIGRARQAGARGVVLKHDGLDLVLDAVRVVARGGTYLSRSLPPELLEGVDRAPDILEVLSDREREVFHLVVRGLTNQRISRELFISPKTVDSHRGRILAKLGCRSAVELVRFAYLNELMPEGRRTLHPEPKLPTPEVPPDTDAPSQPVH
jgi:two-component system response regulator NreC